MTEITRTAYRITKTPQGWIPEKLLTRGRQIWKTIMIRKPDVGPIGRTAALAALTRAIELEARGWKRQKDEIGKEIKEVQNQTY